MAILGLAVVVSKLLGVLQKIPLQNIGGDEAFGIYNTVFPIYTLIMFLAAAGFPVAVSRFAAEYYAEGNEQGMRRVLLISAVYLTAAGAVGFGLLYLGAETIAAWIGAPRTAAAIRSVSFALLFVPLMSALRGYFQGMGRMAPTAVSQVVEQLVRVAVILAALMFLAGRQASAPGLAAGAMYGSAAGGAAGLAVVAVWWLREHWVRGMRGRTRGIGSASGGAAGLGADGPTAAAHAGRLDRLEPRRTLAWRMAKYALAVCLAASVTPVLGMIDSVTVPWLLRSSGADEQEALRQFGIYSRGLPFPQLLAMLLSAMSAAVIPGLAGLIGGGKPAAAREQAELALRVSWHLGVAASVGLAAAAGPINQMFYTNTAGTAAMMIAAGTIAFNCWQIMSAAVLQGFGAVKAAAANLWVAAVCKIGLNLWLVPSYGINGAAAALTLSFAAAALMNSIALRRAAGLTFSFRSYWLQPLTGAAVMAAAVLLVQAAAGYVSGHGIAAAFAGLTGDPMSGATNEAMIKAMTEGLTRPQASAAALLAVSVGAAVYAGMLIALKAYTKQEWRSIRQWKDKV
jgi:O-antigen/teichoic acid export membrane protein